MLGLECARLPVTHGDFSISVRVSNWPATEKSYEAVLWARSPGDLAFAPVLVSSDYKSIEIAKREGAADILRALSRVSDAILSVALS